MPRIYLEKTERVAVGDVFLNLQGERVVVTDAENLSRVKVMFLDNYNYVCVLQKERLLRGCIKNPYFRSVLGVGFLGEGKHKPNKDKYSRFVYNKWKGAIERSYNKRYQSLRPTYIGCTVHPDWHCYQNFADWFEENCYSVDDCELDKDLLFKGNKIYSPDTCCLIPKKINSVLISNKSRRGGLPIGVHKDNNYSAYIVQANNSSGTRYVGRFETLELAFNAYKEAKENHIKELASQYKDQIDPRAYNALMSWEVSIDD